MISNDLLGSIQFDKMQSLGNDFILIDKDQFKNIVCLNPLFLDFIRVDMSKESFMPDPDYEDERILEESSRGNSMLFKFLCNRKFGIGADQLIVYSYEDGILQASFFNNDGSAAEICGNGMRALALLMNKKHALVDMKLEANANEYQMHFTDENEISVNMGRFSVDPENLGFSRPVRDTLNLTLDELKLDEDEFECLGIKAIGGISTGNPHIVFFVEEPFIPETCDLFGPMVSSSDLFMFGVNVGFAELDPKNTEITLSVYERGTGKTLSCGSGACAAAALAHLKGYLLGKDILVKQKGGEIIITVNADGTYTQTGPSRYVFGGKF